MVRDPRTGPVDIAEMVAGAVFAFGSCIELLPSRRGRIAKATRFAAKWAVYSRDAGYAARLTGRDCNPVWAKLPIH